MQFTLHNSALALVSWSVVVLFVLYVFRIPAMSKAKVNLRKVAVKGTDEYKAETNKIPPDIVQIGENYNHLMEQPTIFYALVFYASLHPTDRSYASDEKLATAAWAYVVLRVVHSLVQCFYNRVPLRFAVFAASSLVLAFMTLHILLAEIAK
jgi:hypothetical protein